MIRWQQPRPDGDGGTVLVDMELPCPAGHAAHWRHPAAERSRVVGVPGTVPTRAPGVTDVANQLPDGLAEILTDLYRRAGGKID